MAWPTRAYQKDVATQGIDEPLDRRRKVMEKEEKNPLAHPLRSKFQRVLCDPNSKEFRLQELNLGLPRDRREYWPLY
jgi:hypothetical protein